MQFHYYYYYQKLNAVSIRYDCSYTAIVAFKIQNESQGCSVTGPRLIDRQDTVLTIITQIRQVKHLPNIEVIQGLCLSPTAYVTF